ncbi:MAG TPA: cytochrome c [Gemmataceae bacterium]|nr:cytochrome c [Gemmataceae bacterium]
MSRSGVGIAALSGVFLLLLAVPASTQAPKPTNPLTTPPAKPPLRLEPVAETGLIMNGLAHANFAGLERLLKQKPADNEAWVFARGQALLIGETANLLMIRPPKNSGETAWMDHCKELRDSATALARTAATRDFDGSRNALGDLAVTCNRCHQTFRVPTRIVPFQQP